MKEVSQLENKGMEGREKRCCLEYANYANVSSEETEVHVSLQGEAGKPGKSGERGPPGPQVKPTFPSFEHPSLQSKQWLHAQLIQFSLLTSKMKFQQSPHVSHLLAAGLIYDPNAGWWGRLGSCCFYSLCTRWAKHSEGESGIY